MTNTLKENGHWVQDKLDNSLNSSSSLERQHNMDRSHSSSAANNQQETNGGTSLIEESLNDESNGVDESSLEVSVDEEDKEEEEDEEDEEEDEEDEEDEEEEEVQQQQQQQQQQHHQKTNNHKPAEVVVHKINQYNNKLGSTSKEVLEHIDEAIDNVVKHFTVSKSDLLEASTSRSTGKPAHQNNSSSATKSANKAVTKPRKKRKRKSKSNHFNHFGLDNDDFPFELGSSRKKKQPDKSATGKKDASASGNLVGPFVRVERRKHQVNYIVVNSSSKLEDKDNKFSKPNYSSIAKKSSDQVLFKPNDPTWVCVFCKRAPHFKQLGDLYGPHELVSEKTAAVAATDSTAFSQANQSPSTSHHHNNNSLLPSNSAPPTETRNEIWYHEDCVIWSNGIYLAGNRVRNIDEIVLECCDITCSECKLKGANLGCVQKGCNQTFHYICAKESGCELDDESFSMFCQNHKKPINPQPSN